MIICNKWRKIRVKILFTKKCAEAIKACVALQNFWMNTLLILIWPLIQQGREHSIFISVMWDADLTLSSIDECVLTKQSQCCCILLFGRLCDIVTFTNLEMSIMRFYGVLVFLPNIILKQQRSCFNHLSFQHRSFEN